MRVTIYVAFIFNIFMYQTQETYSSLLKAKSKGAGAHAFCPPTVAGGGTTNRPATADRDKTGAVVAGADVETDQQEVGKKRAASTATAPPPRVKEPTLQLEHVK